MAGEVLAGALLSFPDAERYATGPKARRAPAPHGTSALSDG
jgi:hypothetical protein